jgi:transposase
MPRHYIHKTVKDGHHEEKLKIAICEVLSGRSSIRKAAERYGLAKSTIGSYSKRHACGFIP